jgi:anti-sigma B factor antagonist
MFEVNVDTNGSLAVAKLAGELRALDAEQLSTTLGEVAFGQDARLAIDLSALKYVDSSGLSALINLVTRSRLTNGRVILAAPGPFVSGIFSATRLDQWFDICPSLEEAQQKLAAD